MSVTSVRIQPEVANQLDKVAAKLHRSKSSIINQAIAEFLQHQQQEQQRWQETLDALQSIRSDQIVSGEAVHTWMESWGKDTELSAPKAGT